MRTSALKEPFRRHEAHPIITVRDLPYPANTVFNAAVATAHLSELLAWLTDHNVHPG
jgi:predicted GH43/DUF377 family glycosyl hydrolase